MPDAPDDLRSAVTPTELNVWLYWAPPADPKGDPITGYEVQGKPIAVEGPRLTGGSTATLAELAAIINGILPADPIFEALILTPTTNAARSRWLVSISMTLTWAAFHRDWTPSMALPTSVDDDAGFDFDVRCAQAGGSLSRDLWFSVDHSWNAGGAFKHPITVNGPRRRCIIRPCGVRMQMRKRTGSDLRPLI